MQHIFQEWLKTSSMDKNHHLLYLETRPLLMQPKRALSSMADKPHHQLIMILLASPPFTLYLCSFPPNLCSVKPLNFLLPRKKIYTLLPFRSSSKNGEGNFLDQKRKERFQFNSFELETQMIG